MRRVKIIILVVSVLMIAACTATEEPKTYAEGSIAAYLAADGRFNDFLEIADQVLAHDGGPFLEDTERFYTIFAPTDEAFADLQPELLEQLKSDPRLAEELVYHHGFSKPITSEDFGMLKSWSTIITHPDHMVSFTFDEDQIYYDGALIIEKDIQVGSNYVNVLSEVTGVSLLTD